MAKLFTLLLLLATFSMSTTAQYFYVPHLSPGQNPGNLNNDGEYPVGGGLPAGWTTIHGPSATPNWSTAQTIPFSFMFNGAPVTQYQVTQSGVLTFNASPGTAPGYAPAALPSAAIPDMSVCIWGIQGTGSNDNIVSKTFGSAPNRQQWVMFSSYTLGPSNSWTYWSIVLEESTNKIYIVDQRSFNNTGGISVGIQVDGSTAVNVVGSPALQPVAGNDPTPADNSYYEFIQGTQPDNDIAVLSVDMNEFLVISQAPFTVKGILSNNGKNTLNSFTLNYSVNNGPVVSANATGVNLASFAQANYTHSSGWTPSAVGTYTIKVWTSNPNGGVDGNNSNDTAYATVNVVDTFYTRMPLYEVFSSSTCGPCKPGNENFHSVVANFPDQYVSIKYQQNFPGSGDPYFTTEALNRRSYYAINSIPRMEVDGGWDQNASSFTSALHNQTKAKPAFFWIEPTYEILLGENTIKYCVDIEPLQTMNNVTLQIAIIEKITYNNVGNNFETEFRNVMKKMMPSEIGRKINLVKGTTFTLCEEYKFKGSYRLPANASSQINHAIEHSVEDFSNLTIAVWLQNDANKEVYQANFGTNLNTSIQVENLDEFMLFPNPAPDQALATFSTDKAMDVSLELFNSIGQRVEYQAAGMMPAGNHQVSFSVANLSSGIYFVRITADGVASTRQLSVVK